MLPVNFPGFTSVPLVFPVALVFSVFLAFFLFWRAGRYELHASDFLFDIIIVFSAGALIFGRLLDFVVESSNFGWSLKKLVFFNAYPGFDFYGAILGGFAATLLYLKIKRISFWRILDIAAAPLAFAQFLLFSGRFIATGETFLIFAGISSFLVFWILKRLERRKRHVGFFGSLYLVSFGTIQALHSFFSTNKQFFGVHYESLVGFAFLFFGALSWYILSKRNPKDDIKGLFALLLLSVLKIKRIITSIGEADEFAKNIIISPYYLARFVFFLLRLLFLEIVGGTRDFIAVFGTRK